MIDKEFLKDAAAQLGIAVDDTLATRLDAYAKILVAWNERVNLTAITDPTDIVVKHFVDSMAAASLLPAGPFTLIDVGTGAGFPGVPLAMLRPDCELTLLDSLNKRLLFLEAACREVGVTANRVHARAEEGGKKKELRESFDVATARAVGGLPLLCEYCLPFVKVGGRFLALKGPTGEEEKNRSEFAMGLLGGKPHTVNSFTLPADSKGECAGRQIYRIDKIAHTPPTFPRTTVKIAKYPM